MIRLLRFWREYARRYRWWYCLAIVCLIATNILTVAIPAFVENAIDALQAGDGFDGALRWALTILMAGAGIMVVRILSRVLFFNPGRTIEFRVKSALFDRLLSLPQSYFDKMRPGDIISRGTNDTGALRALIGFGSLQLFNVCFTLTLTIARMLQMDAMLTLMCVVPLAAGGFVMKHAALAMFRVQARILQQTARLSDRILESYSGVGVIQTFNVMPEALKRFEVENDRLLMEGTALLKIRAWLLPICSVIGQLCVVLILYIGGQRVLSGVLTIGQLSAFVAYVAIVVAGLRGMGFLIGATQRGYIALGRINEVLQAPNDRPGDAAQPLDSYPEGHTLRVRDLSFTYPGAPEPTLHNLNFDVAEGETIGVFGPTGSGKTTLLNILARIYDPPGGHIKLSGREATEIPVESYWASVALVSQSPFLFSRSIKENLVLDSDTYDDSRLSEVLDDALLSGELESFPAGLETRVGERGVTLSGGQRQRATLARGLYRPFDLLLLDDVMSAVDHKTEALLIESIYRRTAGRSAIIVSHRISALTQADRIIVLRNGAITNIGTHEELLRTDEHYASVWTLQNSRPAGVTGGGT